VVERLGRCVPLLPILGRVVPHAGDFGKYPPGEHIVVAVYEKSGAYEKGGTDWILQLLHQVATLGRGRFNHVNDVAPWPDAPCGQTSVAVPLEAPTWRMPPPDCAR